MLRADWGSRILYIGYFSAASARQVARRSSAARVKTRMLASRPACPVSIWDEDGHRLHRLADSLDDFLLGRATRLAVEFPPSFRLS